MVLEWITLKYRRCGRGFITDPVAHVVTTRDTDLEQHQPSGAKSIDMRVSLTSKYGSRVLLQRRLRAFGFRRYLIKKSDHNDKLSTTVDTFSFC